MYKSTLGAIAVIMFLMVQPVIASSWFSTPFASHHSFKEQLKDDVNSIPYNTSNHRLGSDYRPESFDCTNMVAAAHDYLESKGYDVKIVRGVNGGYSSNHAWLLVGEVKNILHTPQGTSVTLEENSYWIEATTKSVLSEDIPKELYKSIRIYEDYSTGCGWPLSEWTYI